MKFLKVGFSNSTRMSMSLDSFCSPRAYEPKRPILLTANRALISPAWLLRRSIISMFSHGKNGFPALKALLFCHLFSHSACVGSRQPRRPARARVWATASGGCGEGGRAGILSALLKSVYYRFSHLPQFRQMFLDFSLMVRIT
jgi:hypothetical protein